jgi:hypothetical protein
MKKLQHYLDVFVLSGFIASFFYGFLNPLYVSVILSRLDGRIIALGSFMSSAFPVLIGAMLGNRKLFGRLYAVLPALMVAELAVTTASAVLAAVDLMAYYLLTMFIMGVFSASVVFLMQKIKEVKYRRNRAAFDRRYAMADAFGSFAGSAVSIVAMARLRDPVAIAALGVLQTLFVYGMFLLLYRKVPKAKRRSLEEEPHPWRLSIVSEIPPDGPAGLDSGWAVAAA